MDFSYDWLSAQIRHDLNKFLLFFIAYFPCFGPNKKNPKCRNKLNFIVSTCRSFGCPLYSHVQNVPALVSHNEMEGKRHTNKPKAMEDDDATLSADDFASVVRTTTDTSMSIPKQVFISSYEEATRKNTRVVAIITLVVLVEPTGLHRGTTGRLLVLFAIQSAGCLVLAPDDYTLDRGTTTP